VRRIATVLGVALLTLACGALSTPSPTPAEMDDVIANLVLRGVTVHRLVSGDPGCPSSDLHDNAVHMEVAIGSQSALHDIYLLRWRRHSDFEATAAAFDECVAEYEAANPDRPIGQLESEPWRAYGPFWTDQLDQILTDALHAAGGL
jgi:hypothetical protein